MNYVTLIQICLQGDYECEVTDEVDEVHIAAWDHPSLDYIPKDEDIVFTLSLCDALRSLHLGS